MQEYKIFIDHQFTEIYEKEFLSCIIENIITPLSESPHKIIISLGKNYTINKLLNNHYDIIISTGYSLITYSYAFMNNANKKTSKFIQIIYDMNAEKLIENVDSINISKIISQKSKLILLADEIIVYSKLVNDEIVNLYKDYDSIFNISSKISLLSYKYRIIDNSNIPTKRIISSNNYIVVDTSINGATFLVDSFDWIIRNIEEETPNNFKIVLIIEDKLPKAFYENIFTDKFKEHFILLRDLKEEELSNIYKYSIASIFPSSIDVNPNKIYLALSQNSLLILNGNNEFYNEIFPNCTKYDFKLDNIIKSINDYKKFLITRKHILINEQKEDLKKIMHNSQNEIEYVINKL